MKVVIKLIRGTGSEINAEPTDTILVVKTKIKESPTPLGFAVDSQKILCSGEVLKDDRTLESYGFSENAKDKYLVLMVKKQNGPPTVPPNAQSMSTPLTNTETTSSAEPSYSTLLNQENLPPTVPPNALTMPRPSTNTATISSAEAGPSDSGVLIPSSVQPSSEPTALPSALLMPRPTTNTATISSAEAGPSDSGVLIPNSVQPSSRPKPTVLSSALSMPRPTPNTAIISSAEAGPLNSGVLIPSSVRPSSQSSTFNHSQSKPVTAQIVGVGPDGDQKVLATLEGSQIDDFEQLKTMGFSMQATVEAYLHCDKNVEHAATYLSENGDANSSGTSQITRRAELYGVDSKGDKKLLAILEGSEVDDIEALQAMGFSQQATVEAYLLCDKEKERAASFLIENGNDGNDSSSSNSASADNITQLIASLGGPEHDQIKQLEGLGFPHAVALAAYLACNKNAQLAASVLVERGADLNFGSGNEPASTILNTPLALPSTSDANPSPASISETSGSPPTPSSMPTSPPMSLLAEVSPTSEPTTINDSEVEDNFSSEEQAVINKLEKMGFPREAVIEAVCVCNGDEECSLEYVREKGY